MVILADPPWHYRDWGARPGETHNRSRGAARRYPTMTTEQIAGLPVADLAGDRAALFLWATWPMIEDALAVIKGWGFQYKTLAWEWVKPSKRGTGWAVGMGRYTRSNPEPCLLAFRGRPLPVACHSVLALLVAPRGRHSEKPAIQYDLIELLYPGRRYLELFARQTRPGWAVWGNEVESTVEL